MSLNVSNVRRMFEAEQRSLDEKLTRSFNALMDGSRPNNGSRIEALASERRALSHLIVAFNEYAGVVNPTTTDVQVGESVPVTYGRDPLSQALAETRDQMYADTGEARDA